MLQSGTDTKYEEQIKQLFNDIRFSKMNNRKIFEKWKASQLSPADLSVLLSAADFMNSVGREVAPPLSSGHQDSITRHEEFAQSRQELAQQLEEIKRALQTEGEDAAATLLLQYTQTLSTPVKYFAIACLILVVGVFVSALLLSK